MVNEDKITYSIGHVSEIANIAQSTIRYWETVFDILEPIKTPGGSRRYTKTHVELISTIRDLLHNQGFTIKGANQYLKGSSPVQSREKVIPYKTTKFTDHEEHFTAKEVDTTRINFQYIKNELKKIKRILE